MKRNILALTLFTLLFFGAKAQTDTSFWFAYPYYTLHRPTTADHAFYTYDQSTDIHVEFFDMDTATGEVISDRSFTQNLPPNWAFQTGTSVYMRGDTCYRTTGIHATTSAPVTSVFTSRDHYTLKGHNALGTHFLVPTPKNRTRPYDDNYIRSLRTCIEIIATEDHTQVQIDPAADLLCGTPAHTPLNITLQRGQTYYAPAASTDPQHQLGGSIVTANHPIAVNITADSVTSRENDHYNVIGEQLVPTRLLGKEYELQRFEQNEFENLQITFYPLYDSTRCLYFGNNYRTSFILNRGDDTTAFTYSSTNYYEFDKPVAAFATAYYYGYFGGTELPRKNCSGSCQAALTPTTFCSHNMYGLYVPDSTKNQFSLSSGGSTSTIHLSNDWNDSTRAFGRFEWQSGFDRLYNPAPFQLAELRNNLDTLCGCTFTILTDYVLDEGYMYFNMDQHYCQGDTMFFTFEREGINHFQLTGPNGFFNTEADSLYLIADTAYTGWYHLRSTDPTACDTVNDSIFITIHTPLYQELFDTIVENQLPWHRFDTTFLNDIDTLFIHPTSLAGCDTTFDYHLKVYFNHYDTVFYYICNNQLPFTVGELTFYGDGCQTLSHAGSHGQDSLISYSVHVIPSTDTTIYDSILEDQLPYLFLDTLFTDTITDFIYHTYNEAGCDSTIHYNLHIYWEGDHCDTTLEYPTFVTPNGDGVNDRFIIKGLITNNCFKYNELTIYDRYGKQVYHHRNIASDDDWWNPAAQRAPVGTYFYYFKAHGVHIWTQHTGLIEVLHDK